jgi:hypothetical protein
MYLSLPDFEANKPAPVNRKNLSRENLAESIGRGKKFPGAFF